MVYVLTSAKLPYHFRSWKKDDDRRSRNNEAVGEDLISGTLSQPKYHRFELEKALGIIEQRGGDVGKSLVNIARGFDRSVDIVCWPGVPGEFLCSAEASDVKRPTIMWDPYTPFDYYTRLETSTGHSTKLQRVTMPPWMVLAHEMGHWWHWCNFPKWFEAKLKQASDRGRIDDVDDSTLERPKGLGGAKAYGVAGIEYLNLLHHENPIAQAAGIPLRFEYQDFVGGSIERSIQSSKVTVERDPHTFTPQEISARPWLTYVAALPSDLTSAKAQLDQAIVNRRNERQQEERQAALRRQNELASLTHASGAYCETCNKPMTSTVMLNRCKFRNHKVKEG